MKTQAVLLALAIVPLSSFCATNQPPTQTTNVNNRTQGSEANPLISSGVTPAKMEEFTLPDGTKGTRISAQDVRDPLESDPRYAATFKEADVKARAELEKRGVKLRLGYCHAYWKEKKEILRRDYSIDWKTPSELNPFTSFD